MRPLCNLKPVHCGLVATTTLLSATADVPAAPDRCDGSNVQLICLIS